MAEIAILLIFGASKAIYESVQSYQSPRVVVETSAPPSTPAIRSSAALDDPDEYFVDVVHHHPESGSPSLPGSPSSPGRTKGGTISKWRLEKMSKQWEKREKLLDFRLTTLQRNIANGRAASWGMRVDQLAAIEQALAEARKMTAVMVVAMQLLAASQEEGAGRRESIIRRPSITLDLPRSFDSFPFPPPKPPKLYDLTPVLPRELFASEPGAPPPIYADISPPSYDRVMLQS